MGFLGIKRRITSFSVNCLFAGVKYFNIKRKLLNWAGYKIGEGTNVVGPFVCTATIEIGKNCWIGKNFIVNGNGKVAIGDNCDIAPEVTFLTGGHKIGEADRRAGKGEHYSIYVGNGTWIGARSTLGKSITIGNGCVVGACACVLKDIPDNCLVGGVPAKVIKELDD